MHLDASEVAGMATVDVATGPHVAIVERAPAEAVATIIVRGDLDGGAIPEVAQAIAQAVSQVSAHVVLDLADVAFVDVAGLEFLVRARRRLAQGGGTLTVSRPTTQVERLLAVCGIVGLRLSSRGVPPGRAPAWQSPRRLAAVAREAESREYAT
jgi:anti-anti-sigma factor